MSQHFHCEKVWRGFSKLKYPTLAYGSLEYQERRKAFFVGAWTMLGFVTKSPESHLPQIIDECVAEIQAALRGDSAVDKVVDLRGGGHE